AKAHSKYNLSFITDEDLKKHTLETVSRFRTGMSLAEFRKNIVDPIKLTFDAHVYRRRIEDVIDAEYFKQLSKSNEAAIIFFHQKICGYLKNQWQMPEPGDDEWDIENQKDHVFVKFKERYDSKTTNDTRFIHARMRGLIEGDSKARCYLVEIVTETSHDVSWMIKNVGLREDRQERLRRISVDRFYELVTGKASAFTDLCLVLGQVIKDTLDEYPKLTEHDLALQKLKTKEKDYFAALLRLRD
ncbi:MAG: Eco47II family restriction endonuclease, partial [Kiritimatiellae bacterium]|nr:Eco47II family restriction endonuclease [Kiritimatiellia bacterium]